jgi:hypothetical protein
VAGHRRREPTLGGVDRIERAVERQAIDNSRGATIFDFGDAPNERRDETSATRHQLAVDADCGWRQNRRCLSGCYWLELTFAEGLPECL